MPAKKHSDSCESHDEYSKGKKVKKSLKKRMMSKRRKNDDGDHEYR